MKRTTANQLRFAAAAVAKAIVNDSVPKDIERMQDMFEMAAIDWELEADDEGRELTEKEQKELLVVETVAELLMDWMVEQGEEADPEACPGCGCKPGEGTTIGCNHKDGCGLNRYLAI